MTRYLFLILFLSNHIITAQPVTTDWQPVNINRWQHNNHPQKKAAVLGGNVYNYRDSSGQWSAIDNHWLPTYDSFSCHTGLLKSTVFPNGTTRITYLNDKETITVSKQLIKLSLIRLSDLHTIPLETSFTWNQPIVKNNIIRWNTVATDVDYAIIKSNGKVEQRLYLHPQFFENLKTMYTNLSDYSDLYLANHIRYTISKNSLKLKTDLSHHSKRIIKKLKEGTLSTDSQHLFYPDWQNHPLIKIKQLWLYDNNQLQCVEIVPLLELLRIHLLYPAAVISHNDAYTFTAAEGADTYIQNGATANTNFGVTNSTLKCSQTGDLSSGQETGGLLAFDLSAISGAVQIDSSILHLYFGNAADSVYLERMLTPWDEGNLNANVIDAEGEYGATWNYARDSLGTISDWAWNNNAFSSSDYDDKSGSFYGQLKSTAYHAYCYNGEQSSGNNSQLISDWINNIIPNYGYSLRDIDTVSITTIRPFEFPVTSIQPWLYLEWTELDQPATISLRRRKMILKGELQ